MAISWLEEWGEVNSIFIKFKFVITKLLSFFMRQIKKRWLLIVNLLLIALVVFPMYFDFPFNLALRMNTEDLVKTLSVGFLLSSIFYAIVVYLPQQNRRK